ncbi:MAG TPA: glycosyltransferase [Allosphingosinicella sp.]|nr:glycosyltransferase [Allosphingosinicella sp.]
MRLSAIVPVYNGGAYLPAFFESLAAAAVEGMQLIIVDDGSTEAVGPVFPDRGPYSDVRIVTNATNLGYATAVNRGVALADGEIIVQLNTDLLLRPDCLHALIRGLVSKPRAGIVGSKLVFPTTGRIQHAGMAFGRWSRRHIFFDMPADHPLCRTRRLQMMTGAVAALTRPVLDRLGPLDEGYYNSNEDVDHCLRAARLGLENWLFADSVAYHWVSQSGPARFAGIREADALFWSNWGEERSVDLGEFVAEAIEYILSVRPDAAAFPFVPLDLTRSADHRILLDEIERFWPGAGDRTVSRRVRPHGDGSLRLPMLLPHWTVRSTAPFIYLVDRLSDLTENRLWFETRLGLVDEEILLDTTGAIYLASVFLAERVGR